MIFGGKGAEIMCLDVVYRGKQKKEALAKLPDEFPVWKVLKMWLGELVTGDRYTPVDSGELKAPYLGELDCGELDCEPNGSYLAGWHAFTDAESASTYRMGSEEVVQCAAKKCHVREIGGQYVRSSALGQVVVLSHITFPKKCGKAKK
jgi:hypothetical protein